METDNTTSEDTTSIMLPQTTGKMETAENVSPDCQEKSTNSRTSLKSLLENLPLSNQDFETFDSHIEAYKFLTEAILKSAEIAIPKTKGKPKFKEALSSTKTTAPGEDTVLYEMIKNLPEDAKTFLLKIINRTWETDILPKSWKIAIIIPIKKPNKNPLDPSSYRLALTSCVCKLMEKMRNTRLVWYLESENKLSPYQFGFRKNRSTLDPLLRLSNQIQQGFSKQCQMIGVFFDLEKAYDTTSCKHLQNSINAVSRWADSWGFKISTIKTSAVRFTRRRQREVIPTLNLNGTILPYAEETEGIDIVHNMGLRICSGAFRTSPVENIYVDSGELPLDLRREELGLRLLFKIKTDCKNPAFDTIRNVNGDNFLGSRSSKPLQVRLNEQVEDVSIKTQNVFQVGHPHIPPWIIPEISKCSIEITKRNISIEQVKSIFLEHDKIHEEHIKIYTDGSKSNNGVGYGVIHDDTSYLSKLPDSASIFTAEISAINHALKLRSGYFIFPADTEVHFCWVPSHVGIHGNELADKEAKEAAQCNNIPNTKIPHSDMKRIIKSHILNKWQEQWSSPVLANNKKYKNIRNSINPWVSGFNLNRKKQVILTRLRIGHIPLTHKFILDSGSAPECAHCGTLMSVEHILVHCPKFLNIKTKYNLHSKSLKEILGEEADIDQLFGFLKETNLLKDI
ncbi:uncharacterized protein LOC143026096 [Oratosquilla oratoria]|uniref:uncharacterized protein LOC143026096 n=1 Tax=Oratosquilla oratoria TaxID=337810 RepID=UPI003F76C8BC